MLTNWNEKKRCCYSKEISAMAPIPQYPTSQSARCKMKTRTSALTRSPLANNDTWNSVSWSSIVSSKWRWTVMLALQTEEAMQPTSPRRKARLRGRWQKKKRNLRRKRKSENSSRHMKRCKRRCRAKKLTSLRLCLLKSAPTTITWTWPWSKLGRSWSRLSMREWSTRTENERLRKNLTWYPNQRTMVSYSRESRTLRSQSSSTFRTRTFDSWRSWSTSCLTCQMNRRITTLFRACASILSTHRSSSANTSLGVNCSAKGRLK